MEAFESQRKILASPRKIFKAFEDPTLLTKWWGPDGFTCTFYLFEFKPQGKWSFIMHGQNGAYYHNEIVFEKISAPGKIVMRHAVEPCFTLTVAIEETEDGAVIFWKQDFDSEAVASHLADIVRPANEQIMDKLKALVERS